MALLVTQVHNAIVAAALAGVFHPKVLDPTTKLLSVDESVGARVTPAQVLVDEVSGSYGEAHSRRTYSRARSTWTWRLFLGFPKDVVLEVFERSLTTVPITVPRDPTNGVNDQVTLDLVSCQFEHPAQQQPTNGTRVTYTFEARLAPR